MIYQFLALLLLFFFRERSFSSRSLSLALLFSSLVCWLIISGSSLSWYLPGRVAKSIGGEQDVREGFATMKVRFTRSLSVSASESLSLSLANSSSLVLFRPSQWVGWKPRQRAGLMIMSFGLIVLYLPMSTMAVHALIWS